MRELNLTARQTADFELLANGGFSPLEGFMGSADWESVVRSMHLANGSPWPMPITLASATGEVGERLSLVGSEGTALGTLDVAEVYERDLRFEAQQVYRTDDERHPGVATVYGEGARTLAGPITAHALPRHPEAIQPYVLSPAEARQEFRRRGWKRIVGFQTRNPIHRAHEYITKSALEITDGLFIHPIVGQTKPGDIPAQTRMRCYLVLIDRYYPAGRVILGVNPAAMRYAGPREAVFHALVRRNYGCTHFIVGRDHAGVGDYYGTYDSQLIFDEFEPGELGIEPLKFEHAFWCTVTKTMATEKTSPSAPHERIFLSGTKVRELLSGGERPPEEFSRAEVADVLIDAYSSEKQPA